jgi:hypothetical protein
LKKHRTTSGLFICKMLARRAATVAFFSLCSIVAFVNLILLERQRRGKVKRQNEMLQREQEALAAARRLSTSK